MSVIVDNTSPPASLESNQMPTWNQLQQQQQPSNPDSGFVDVEAMRDALASVEHSGGSGTPGQAVSKFENEWTMPREPAAAHQVPAAMFNDEQGTCVQSPHAQQQQAQVSQNYICWFSDL